MKTNLFNITAIALMISTSFITGRSTLENNQLELPGEALTEMAELNTSEYVMVEAKIVDGNLIPVVNLPELNIVADYNDDKMVTAKIIDGEVVPFVQLPVLTITAE